MGNKIIINSFNGIGDLLFVTPTIARMKKTYGDRVHISVHTNYPMLLEGNPYVDNIQVKKHADGIFLGYPDPIHGKWPNTHHIYSDWQIVQKATGLECTMPELKPELYCHHDEPTHGQIGVQVLHKGHWDGKKVWPKFDELSKRDGFFPIPHFSGTTKILDLVQYIQRAKLVVCAEGGISHIARAVETPAIVIYGGFASPKWNGYEDHVNITNEKHCSFCYSPRPCDNEVHKICMKEITVEQVIRAANGLLSRISELEDHNAMQFVRDDAIEWCRGNGIDVGAGNNPLPGARWVDDDFPEDANNIDAKDNSLDFVFSSHCLEHLNDPLGALREWVRVLKPGGILYLYLPHPDYARWRSKNLQFHKWDFSVSLVTSLFNDLIKNMELLEIVEKDYYFGQKYIFRKEV